MPFSVTLPLIQCHHARGFALSGGCRKACSRFIAAGDAIFPFDFEVGFEVAGTVACPPVIAGHMAQIARFRTIHHFIFSALIEPSPCEGMCGFACFPNEISSNRKNLKERKSVCQSNFPALAQMWTVHGELRAKPSASFFELRRAASDAGNRHFCLLMDVCPQSV
jgi:hypothetical protein